MFNIFLNFILFFILQHVIYCSHFKSSHFIAFSWSFVSLYSHFCLFLYSVFHFVLSLSIEKPISVKFILCSLHCNETTTIEIVYWTYSFSPSYSFTLPFSDVEYDFFFPKNRWRILFSNIHSDYFPFTMKISLAFNSTDDRQVFQLRRWFKPWIIFLGLTNGSIRIPKKFHPLAISVTINIIRIVQWTIFHVIRRKSYYNS